MERRKFLAGAAGIGGLGAVLAAGMPDVAHAQAVGGIAIPITGFNRLTGAAFVGTFSPQRALVNGAGQLVIEGAATLAGIGGSLVQLPVIGGRGTCTILDLELGPLDLNLLGLEIHLNRIHLVIEANPQGGLLGQLLCGIANLLNGGLPAIGQLLDRLVGSLNDLLRLFR